MDLSKMSWKTTLCGVLALFSSLSALVLMPLLDSDPATSPSWMAFFTAASGAVGLLFSRDNDKRSEDVNAGK